MVFCLKKQAEAAPWEPLCIDLIGPYTPRRKHKKALTLWCLTMIDPATVWFEMVEIKDKTSINIAEKVQQTWLAKYPRPTNLVYDKGTEFMKDFAITIEDDYGIKRMGITKRNPQASQNVSTPN